ncbi:unnamed protein product [Arabidopsis lyrata]|uniref:W2 domain-containing protein n=1 Tax=Arabidopsis lyrata subsp. lyrata TaxID=81972 RepID=D7KYT9_ARALL|nr:hypothetical protein ARALYDRAFT_476265 [Arabidopsis lyrata subsp. lyrata]CAH8257829.1 unnamed protein product [Arabidopsis lyrata]
MEGGAEDLSVEIVGLLETAYERREPMTKIRKQLERMSETLAEAVPHSKYAEAIVKGMLLAVQRRANLNVLLSIQETIDQVFDTYGPILIQYATSKTTQIQIIESVEKICLEPQSPFFPVFGHIIQTLSRHCVNVEAIVDWEERRKEARERGILSPQEMNLLRNMENTQSGPTGGILEGFEIGKGSQDARDMGL